MALWKLLVGVTGVAFLATAALGFFGAIALPRPPSAAIVGCGPNGNSPCGSPALTAGFTWTSTGKNLTLIPTGYLNLVGSVLVNVSWGDSSKTTGQVLGAHVSHTYTTYASYSVTESETAWAVNGLKLTSTASASIPIGQGTTGGSNGNATTNSTCISVVNTCASFSGAPFTLSSQGNAVTVADQTVLVNMRVTSLVWSWGDNSTSTGTLDGTISHAYLAYGTYRVAENITATGISFPNTPLTVTKSFVQNVTLCATPSCSGPPPPPTPPNATPVVLGLVGGSFLAAAAPVAGTSRFIAIGSPAAAAVGLLAYSFAGGVL